ncbi:TNF receptor-associated factor 2-like [Saccoglossus kowalevskii]
MASSTLKTVECGYSRSILKDEHISQKCICTFCDHVLRDPFQSYCGHRFCRRCIEGQVSDGKEYCCPICVVDDPDSSDIVLTTDKIYPDRAIFREMKRIPVVCTNTGCDWTGLFIEYQQHEDICEYMVVICARQGCLQNILRCKLKMHSENECHMRIITCKYCNTELVYQELEVHYQSCPKIKVQCKYCNIELLREKLLEHTAIEGGDCSSKRQPCTFHTIGCSTLVEMGKEADNNVYEIQHHTDLILSKTIELGNAMASLEERNVQTRQLCTSVEHSTADIQTIETRLHKVEADLQRHIDAEKKNHTDVNIDTDQAEKINNEVRQLNHKLVVIDRKVSTSQEIVAMLNENVDSNSETTKKLQENGEQLNEMIQLLERQCKAQDRSISLKDVALAEQDLRIHSLEMTSYNGILLWKISDFARKRRDAISGRALSIYSPYFFTDRHGYKLCARIYLNGDGMGKGNHVSLFFVVMKGEYDAILKWPFRQKVTLMWLDQSNREHVIDAFRPDPSSTSFKRPKEHMNIASGCPLFMPLNTIDTPGRQYVKDDVAFIKIIVDTTDM